MSKEISGFVKNYDLLKEDSRVDDLIDFSSITNGFINKLNTINKPSIVGLIGKFGSGKSTMLYQVEKQLSEKNLWVNFDAWKYPDRKDMWEGLIIEFAHQIGKRTDIIKKIDGEQSSEAKRINTYNNIAEGLTGLPIFKSINEIYKTFHKCTPIKRLFEQQEIFETLINGIESNIYIVLEDVDRSGDYGLYLLETLKQFLQNTELKNKVTVIVPIGSKLYSENLDAYLKCLDIIEFFDYSKINLDKFFEEIIKKDLLHKVSGNRYSISQVFEYVFKEFPDMTIRKMKTILRKADINYQTQQKDGYKPIWQWTVIFELSKYLDVPNKSDKVTYFQLFKKNGNLLIDQLFNHFLYGCVENRGMFVNPEKREKLIGYTNKIKFISSDHYTGQQDGILELKPIFNNDQIGLGIYDYYLNY